MLSPEAGVSFGVLFGKSGSAAFALSGVYTNSGRMDYYKRYHVRLQGTENERLAINCKSLSITNKDQEMVLYLDDKKEPWGQIPKWDRAEITAEKIVNCSRRMHNESFYKFTFKSGEGKHESQHEVLIENKDCEKVLQWFCNAWGEVDITGKMQVVVETVGMGVPDDIGYRLIAMSTQSDVSNERRYYVKVKSIIRVSIRNLSNETISFTPVYHPSSLQEEPDEEPEPHISLPKGVEDSLCKVQVDCNFEWSLEHSDRVMMPKLIFETGA